jgi:hypothetical protein
MAFPISQRAAVDPDESTAEAIADWHYRVARATASELRTATESSRCFPYAADQACKDLPEEERSEPKLNFGSPRPPCRAWGHSEHMVARALQDRNLWSEVFTEG